LRDCYIAQGIFWRIFRRLVAPSAGVTHMQVMTALSILPAAPGGSHLRDAAGAKNRT
jgi:hypothetical protein